MSRINGTRSGCKDVFHSYLVSDATYDGDLEIPVIKPTDQLPNRLISFSKAMRTEDYDQWVHFYEDDACFERVWNRPDRYLPKLKRFNGVITPDFSLYRDMPLVMQQWNIYRSHVIAAGLQKEGVSVLANVRWGDERTYKTCCLGVPKNASFAVGSHGCIKVLQDRKYFVEGLAYVIDTLKPKTIVVYGTAPEYIFGKYRESGITILQFDSDCMVAHRKAVSD